MINQTPFFNDEFDMTKRAMYNALNSSSSCSIGIVKSISLEPISVTVQNCNKYFDKIQGFQEPPILQNIPVAQMANSAYSIKTPLNIGDIGLLLWFDREVYTFLTNPDFTSVSPDSGTLNNESACVFIPIMQKFSQANELKQTGVEIKSGTIGLIQELLNLTSTLNTFMTSLITAGAPYAGNPTTPVVGSYAIAVTAAATIVNSALTTLTTALTTFKGAQT